MRLFPSKFTPGQNIPREYSYGFEINYFKENFPKAENVEFNFGSSQYAIIDEFVNDRYYSLHAVAGKKHHQDYSEAGLIKILNYMVKRQTRDNIMKSLMLTESDYAYLLIQVVDPKLLYLHKYAENKDVSINKANIKRYYGLDEKSFLVLEDLAELELKYYLSLKAYESNYENEYKKIG